MPFRHRLIHSGSSLHSMYITLPEFNISHLDKHYYTQSTHELYIFIVTKRMLLNEESQSHEKQNIKSAIE